MLSRNNLHIFFKSCVCGSKHIPFRSEGSLDDHVVTSVFCPLCSHRAPAKGLVVAVTGVPGWSGTYAIRWNHDLLEERDPRFKNHERYYGKLFTTGRVSFGFLPRLHADRAYTIWD